MEHFKDMPASPQTVDQYCFDAQYILFVPLLFVPALFFPLLFVSSIWNWEAQEKKTNIYEALEEPGNGSQKLHVLCIVFLGEIP